MNRKLSCAIAALSMLSMTFTGCQKSAKYDYTTFEGDQLETKLYTLPNGLKVFMTVNDQEPRIQTCIAVRVGSKNDPAETTGLAHYLEHIMFKGSESLGTTNYAAEKPLLDQIEALYETYRQTTDEAERKAIYHQIDSISFEASKIAIANEYDKSMAAIGSKGTNAYTSNDVTCYIENIPSNQIENWAKVQGDRFQHMVIRGFHTELEAVYEEKNISMTNDSEKQWDMLNSQLFPNHPYGTQTTIGTQEHLKNPSITNIKKFFNQWYRPNNVAICVSGDFNPDEMVDAITKYFGNWQPAESFPTLTISEQPEITEPIVKEVYGNESENIMMGWRMAAAKTRDALIGDLIGQLLYNGEAGLLDLNLNQQHKVLDSYSYFESQADFSSFLLGGEPMPGQSLEDVKNLVMAEVAKIANGDFSEDLLEAIKNNKELRQQRMLENNMSRARMYVNAFINGKSWADQANEMNEIRSITKDEIVAFAKKNITDKNYVIVKKLQGEDKNIIKVVAPEITTIMVNRDSTSTFLADLKASTVTPIEPKFTDFNKEMQKATVAESTPLYYTKNETNSIFTVEYTYPMGLLADPTLNLAADFINTLGTDSLSAEQIKMEMYKLGCSLYVHSDSRESYVSISGLSTNMSKAIALMDHIINHAKVDEEALEGLRQTEFQQRDNDMKNMRAINRQLNSYIVYGKDGIKKVQLSRKEIETANGDSLIASLKRLYKTEHNIAYYGPDNIENVKAILSKTEAGNGTPLKKVDFANLNIVEPKETSITIVDYKANSIMLSEYSNIATEKYDTLKEPFRQLFNEYFGSGMNAIVFQEMRERRGLAYSAGARYSAPSYKDSPYIFMAQISTQNDKLKAAVESFSEIIEEMPVSESAFNLAKESAISQMRTQRTKGRGITNLYINNKEFGIDHDIRPAIFEKIQTLTLDDIVAFQQQNVKNRKYHFGIVGDAKQLDLNLLKSLGKVEIISASDVFGN